MASTSEQRTNLKHNYIVNLLDGGFFGLAMGFASFSTILPLFVSTLTNSATLIGLIPAIHNAGWQLPQLLTAKKLSRMLRYKPFVMLATIHERLPFVGMAIVAFLLPGIGKDLALFLTFLFLVWQGLGGGITANAWQNMVSKVIPPDFLATFFGFQSAASSLLSSGGAVAAGLLLENLQTPLDFTVCFLIASFFMAFSWFFLNMTRESEKQVEFTGFSELSILKSVKKILRENPSFRWYLISRILTQFTNMALSFYIVYAVRFLGMDELSAGIMTGILLISQVVSGIILGWLADKLGKRPILILGAAISGFSAIMAILATSISPFYFIFPLAGIGNSVYWTVGMAFTMEFGNDEERPTYVGMANSLIAPAAIIAPLFGGWVADISNFPSTFLISAISSVMVMLIILLGVRKPSQQVPVESVE